ncbi:MAG: phosphomethylpyrimidine synthase ThiC, partial [Hyphomicrobiales bacterium]|nr:phosphomethylpyrimidine synthase ThiC [Hyphomicrobiales bacterium]
MNAHPSKPIAAAPQTVTTGPIAGSRKYYATPAGRPDMRVPLREIVLSDPALEPVRVYDPSGPYTDDGARIDLAAGLAPLREPWIAKLGLETVSGRAIRPEDNGGVSAENLVPECPAPRPIRRAAAGRMVTQLEFARAGVVTPEMVYVAHRENLGRAQAAEGAGGRRADGESFGASIPEFVTPEFV